MAATGRVSGRRWAPSAIAVGALWAVIPAAGVLCLTDRRQLPPSVGQALTGALIVIVQLVCLTLSLRTAVDRTLPVAGRRPWRWVAASSIVSLALAVLFSASATWPGLAVVAMVLRLFVPVLMLAAVFSFPAPRLSLAERFALGMDMTMIAGATLLALWYFLIGPALLAGVDLANLAPAVTAPVLDLALISGACLVVMRGTLSQYHGGLGLLTAAAAALVVPDLYISYSVTHGGGGVIDASTPQFVGFSLIVGFALMALAARSGRVAAPDPSSGSVESTSAVLPYLPYVAMVLGYSLLLLAAARSGLVWSGLIAAAILMTGGVVVRQLVPLLENQRLATTDHLTGLVNRRGLMLRLERAVDRASSPGSGLALLLFDLNGFKLINDSLGHAAGDTALIEFGRVLQRNVLGRETVARLGGDEFAVVLTDVRTPGQAVIVAERIIADLAQPVSVAGTPLRLRTSVGIAVLARAGLGVEDLLHQADQAMYEAKRSGPSSWCVHTDELGEAEPEADTDAPAASPMPADRRSSRP